MRNSTRACIPGDEGAEGAEGLAERADQHRHGAGSRPNCSSVPPPRAPSTPSPCASSTTSQACASRAASASCGSGRQVPVHAEHPVGGQQRCILRAGAEHVPRGRRVRVRIALERRTREARAIDERGVAEPVEHRALAAPGEAGHDRKVRRVAAGEQQRALAAREVGEFLLQLLVFAAMAAHQVRGGAAGAGDARRTRPSPAPGRDGAPAPDSRCC